MNALDRLAQAFQKRVQSPLRQVDFALVIGAVVLAGLCARFGSLGARLGALALLVATLAFVVVRRVREGRDFRSRRRTISRVLMPTDRALGERAMRAVALVETAEHDPSVGSRELANLHFERLLAKASLDAVEARGAERGLRFRLLALVLFLAALATLILDRQRVFEGLDVFVARNGRAPIPMLWLDLVHVSSQPPAYLKGPERFVFSGATTTEPKGSTITVRGLPRFEGRKLVLTDGKREVPFMSDGTGGTVARWTLDKDAALSVAARFGDVLIHEPVGMDVRALVDEAPRVEVEGAPRQVKLSELERLEIQYLASDDHGLRQIDLVLRSGDREDRRVLARLDGESKLERGGHALEPRDPFLRRMFLPVEITIEARDNDALSGAKWGKSEPITVLPPSVGESEVERYTAIESVRSKLLDLLAFQLETPELKEPKARAERDKEQLQKNSEAADALRSAANTGFAGLRIPPGLRAFLGGQARQLEKSAHTPKARQRRTEDVVLAVDAALRALGTRDAQAVAKRLGDVAEEVADGAKEALETERRANGLRRVKVALPALDQGAKNLLVLGALGRDLGSVAEGEIRRIRRAEQSQTLSHVELAARHLAARLRRPNPSFSSSGGGGVEAGTPGSGGQPSEAASDADQKFNELVGELERLAQEHQSEIDRNEREMQEAENSVNLDDLKQEARERADALRDALEELPQFAAQPASARAAAALAREHGNAMAQNLERLALKDTVESGRQAASQLDDALKKAQNPRTGSDLLDEQEVTSVREEVERQLAWAEQALERAKKSAQERSRSALDSAAEREQDLARRASDLAGRGSQGEAALPEDLTDALERAESVMREATREMREGKAERATALQREAQRLLEQSNTGQTDEADEGPGDERESSHGTTGKKMRMDADVPGADEARRAEDFRRRVLRGLGKDKGGRLAPAVRRYAEGLLR